MSSITKAMSRYNAIKYLNLFNKNRTNFKNRQKVLFHWSPSLSVKGQEIKMPSLSPTMSEGKIVKWLKKEGDTVSPGDVLCDIETDKAVVSMETEEEGILAKIIVPENSGSVSIGTLIALMVEEGEDWKKIELPTGETAAPGAVASGSQEAEKAMEVEEEVSSSAITVKMPSLSPTMTAGTILKWYKKEGESICAGDVLCDIQTDKAVISMESDEEGIVAKILVPEDTKDVKVGTLIALMVPEGEDWKTVTVPKSAAAPKKASSSAGDPDDSGARDSPPAEKDRKSFGPAVRSLLSIYQLDAEQIKATGRRNKLLKEDVLKYVEENNLRRKPPKPVSLPSASPKAAAKTAGAPKRAPAAGVAAPAHLAEPPVSVSQSFGRKSRQKYTDIEVTNIRKIIAQRLTTAKYEIPHAYVSIRCDADELLRMRKIMNYHGIVASLNDYVIKAAALTLQESPKINVVHVDNQFTFSTTIDISVAVATPTGLITPIVKNADEKGIVEISSIVRELAGRARAGKLKPHEFQGGSFSISNLGMFGIKRFTAIINPPQTAILAVGGAMDRFGSDRKNHKEIFVTLSYDRRCIQEDEAAEFLEKLKLVLEHPKRLVAENSFVARSLSY